MNIELWERWQREADASDIAKWEQVSGNEWLAPIEWMGFGPCESPIERQLWRVLQSRAEHFGLKAITQFKHGPYRYDFAIEKDSRVLAVIECDGWAFHCSPAQLARDRAKDLLAEQSGFEVFRFSGREIHRSARSCVEEVIFRLWRPEWRQ